MNDTECETAQVALCEEGVDRNWNNGLQDRPPFMSPSAKRAWIEITSDPMEDLRAALVALCEEGVDRNLRPVRQMQLSFRRPLRRGRG